MRGYPLVLLAIEAVRHRHADGSVAAAPASLASLASLAVGYRSYPAAKVPGA